jgi:hypothetical protein
MSEETPNYHASDALDPGVTCESLLDVLMHGSPEAAQGAYWQIQVMWDERGELLNETIREAEALRERLAHRQRVTAEQEREWARVTK